ncbi:hypothetical protein HU200_057728 [Digitaria exilis]|uniref:Uncharacterized protein n=1 Tax=Digitaria exilis TaxID=1010633 RepID=A0A835AK75_9POAL|nr:hypothetical protein HU200_057728 [Digitaria exilis]
MGSSRRFLNLIVNNRIPGTISLRCIDLKRHQLFNTTTPAQSEPPIRKTLKMDSIGLPSPSFSFLSSAKDNRWYINCIPLAGRKVFCTDHNGRTILLDADTRQVDIMPNLQSPKWRPISIFVPSDDASDNPENLEGGSIFVTESAPDSEVVRSSGQLSSQFEAFVYQNQKTTLNPWHHLLLPPPPFVCEPMYRQPPNIRSYAVVGGVNGRSSQICISTEDAGTYSLDTVRHTWSRLGEECALPFHGKVEYVPELKLWLGISSKDCTLAAADLSAMASSQVTPLVVSAGMEFDPPEEWKVCRHPQLVNLGCGRFCIVRFFYTSTPLAVLGEVYQEYFVVLTGVEVVRRDNDVSGNGSKGEVELQMIKHESWHHMCFGTDGTIEAAF